MIMFGRTPLNCWGVDVGVICLLKYFICITVSLEPVAEILILIKKNRISRKINFHQLWCELKIFRQNNTEIVRWKWCSNFRSDFFLKRNVSRADNKGIFAVFFTKSQWGFWACSDPLIAHGLLFDACISASNEGVSPNEGQTEESHLEVAEGRGQAAGGWEVGVVFREEGMVSTPTHPTSTLQNFNWSICLTLRWNRL